MTHRPPSLLVPRHVTVYVNWACNLTCRECWMYGDSAAESKWLEDVRKDQVSVKMWTSLVEELGAQARDKVFLTIMGGEPLIHPKLVELVRIAKQKIPDCNIDMSTNATLLKKHAEAVVESGLDDVYISVDGPSPEVNNPIRGKNAFERAMEGLDALQAAIARKGRGPKVALNFVVTGMNYEHLPEMVRLAEQKGVRELTVGLASYFTKAEGEGSREAFEKVTGRPFLSWAGYCNEHQHKDIDPERLRQMMDEAQNLTSNVNVMIAPTRYDSKEKSKFFTNEWRSIVRDNTCVKLWAQASVLPNGDVISCTTFADTVMGNLKDSSLQSIFSGSVYTQMREAIRSGLQPVCHRCCELNMDIDVDPELYEAQPVTVSDSPAKARLRAIW